MGTTIGGEYFSVYDIALILVGVAFVLIFIYRMMSASAVCGARRRSAKSCRISARDP